MIVSLAVLALPVTSRHYPKVWLQLCLIVIGINVRTERILALFLALINTFRKKLRINFSTGGYSLIFIWLASQLKLA